MSVAARFEADSSEDLSSPFYFNASHWRAMDGIIEGIKARDGIMVMTGPTGCGKTMLMRAISENLGEGVTPLFLQYASLNFREFVNFLHKALDVSDHVLDAANKAVALRKFLYAQAERGETAAVLIDEAQNLEPDVLRMLPKLACFDQLENGTNVGLQFMLTGGSELREVLADSDFTEVREAIARDYELRFFTRKELKHFLEKRLAPLSRFTPEPITEDAIAAVGKYTGGSPRLVGMICSHAMLFAAENPGRSIDEAMIEEAAEAQMIDPTEDAFADEDERLDEETGPFSSAELSGDDMDADDPQAFDASQGFNSFRNTADGLDDRYDDLDDESAAAAFADDEYEDDFDDTGFDVMDSVNDEVRMDYDDDDEFEPAEHPRGASAAAGAALAGGNIMGRIRGAVSARSSESERTRIVGAGRKGRNTQREVRPAEKRSMRTRVAGRRQKQLKLAGGAAAILGLVVGVYMVRTQLSNVFASAPEPSGLERMDLNKGRDMASNGGYQPSFGSGSDNDQEAISIIGLPDAAPVTGFSGNDTEFASRDMEQATGAAAAGGWGAKVQVQTPAPASGGIGTDLPELTMPKLPESGVGLARGALDMIDSALEKGKSVLPENVGGAIDVARGDIKDLRVRATANGATGGELDSRVLKLIAEGNEYFERRLYIAPARSNAYDSYRAALDLAPGNEAALKGIERLRAFYAQKAEEARSNKQWDNANRFFETALGISQRKAVR